MLGDEDGLVELPGRENRTCRELQDLADSVNITDEQCNELIPLVQVPCDCIEFVCNICGNGGVSSDPGGIIDIPGDDEGLTTCAAVNEVARAGGFNESFCPTIQELAKDPCGCSEGSIEPTEAPTDEPTSSPRPTRAPSPTSPPVDSPTRQPTVPDFSGANPNVVGFSMAVALFPLLLGSLW